ncbi:MAG: hypothetical protein R3Y36_08710, partial [Spirochaetales bacterium]
MKKYIAILCVLLPIYALCADDYIPSVPTVTSTRVTGMGGYHVTDTADYYTLFANPAGIPAVDGGGVLFNFDIKGGISDPTLLTEAIDIAGDMISAGGFDESMISSDTLTGLIGDNGFNTGIELTGPLAFGTLYKNFGWGFFNKIYASAIIPTISNMNVLAGTDFLLKFAYGAPIINTDNHYLSIGLSVEGFASLQSVYNGSPMTFISSMMSDSASSIEDSVPVYASAGMGFDAGILYKLYDIFSVGLVWNDFYTPVWIQDYTLSNIMNEEFSTSVSRFEVGESSLDVGIGIDIPFGFLDNILDLVIMADYTDLLSIGDSLGRNPILNFSAGTELTLFKFLQLR